MIERDRLLDEQVRQADPDRWLSSRFVSDEQARADLIALYAFEAELMAIPTRVTQPPLAEMRYTWWAEQLDGVFAGVARVGHPVLEALTDIVARHGLDRAPFDALIEAHIGRIQDQPHDLEAFYARPMRLAATLLGAGNEAASVDLAGRVWGLAQVGRRDEAEAACVDANTALRNLPSTAFPAVAHAALRDPAMGAGQKRLRLTWAVLRGRV